MRAEAQLLPSCFKCLLRSGLCSSYMAVLVWLCCAGTTVSLALSLYMLQRYVLFYEGKVRWYRINETFHQPVRQPPLSRGKPQQWWP